jgi:hypothetical protein
MRTNKTARSDRNRKAIAGVQKHWSSLASIVLDGVTYTPATLVKTLQTDVDAADATAAAAAVFHKAVAKEKDTRTTANAVFHGLKTLALSQYKGSPDILADFGLTPPSRQIPAADTVAGAVQKRAATRAARHTMGTRQKAKVKGTVPPTVPATPPPAAPSGSTTGGAPAPRT